MGFTGWTTVLISVAGCLLAGVALRSGGVAGWRRVRYALGLGPGLGLGVASLVLFFGRLVGLGRPGLAELILVFAGLSAVAVAWSRRTRAASGDGTPAPVRPPAALRAAALLALLLGAAGAIESYRVLSRSWPEGTWDAVAIWNARARFLERGYEDVSTLFKQVESSSHPHYPLLVPGAVATQLVIAGEDDDWVPETTGLAFLLGLGLLTFAVVADSGLLSYAAFATAFLLGTPMLLKWGGAQGGDVPLAYFFLGAVAALASQLPGRLPCIPPVLGGVFLGLLAWTKNEGTLMALLLLGLYAAWALACGEGGWRRWRDWQRWRPLIGFGIGTVPGLAAVFLFKRLWAPESGLDTFLGGELAGRILSFERWWIPVEEILKRMLPLKETYGWGLAWPALELGVLLAAWIHWRARRPWTSFWGAALLVTVLSWIPIYVVTPYDQRWHIAGSLDRLLLQIFPAVIAGVFLRVALAAGAPEEEKTRRAEPLPNRLRTPSFRPVLFLAVLLGAALVVKIAAVLVAVPSIWLMADEMLYTVTAWDFAHWGAPGVPHPDFLYYPPLASLLIAPLHRLGLAPQQVYTLSLILFNALLTSAVAAAYLTLRRLYGASSRLLPVLLALAAPCTALVLMSEPLYITMFAWLLYVYVRMLQDRKVSDHLAAGLLLAGMVLTRQVGLFALAAVILAAVADLALGGLDVEARRRLRLYAWTIVPPVLAAVAWRLIAPGLKSGGGSNLPYFLAVAVATPVKLVLGSARRLVSEIGYVSLTTYGFALPAMLWGLFRRAGNLHRRLFSAVVLVSLFLTASASAVFMWYARFHYLPRYDLYGRYVDYFAIPVLVLALGTFWEMRRDASERERWALAVWTLVLNAAFLLVIPERFFPESLKAQIAPNSLGLVWLLELVRAFGPGVRWLLPPAAALLAALLASPVYAARRGVRWAVAAGLAALSLFNFAAGAREVSVQSHGSKQYASGISDYIAANPALFENGLYLDYPGIGYRRSEAPEMAAQHAFIYRVLADHVDKVIAGAEPERFHDRMPVLSRRPFPGWRVLAEWPWVQYRIYAPATPGGG
ncbi:MAG: hypothetical protein ABUT39_14160 [Acidobacteriota bacterium]